MILFVKIWALTIVRIVNNLFVKNLLRISYVVLDIVVVAVKMVSQTEGMSKD